MTEGTAARLNISTGARADEQGGRLRLVICGGSGVGKTTLVDRLAVDVRTSSDTPVSPINEEASTTGHHILSEQDGTVETTHRHIATPRRPLVIADAPDHEGDMGGIVAAMSVSDLALILVDARDGIGTPTRRHSHLAALLGIKQIVLAVNKMDLAGFDQARFEAIAADYRTFAEAAGIGAATAIPVSAAHGDNVCETAPEMPWYAGPTLLSLLENAEAAANLAEAAFRMPVQRIDNETPDSLGCSGAVIAGTACPGTVIGIYPGGKSSRVRRIVDAGGDVDTAVAGQSVTIELEEGADVNRGDMLADPESPPTCSDQFAAHVIWMADEPLLVGRRYDMKIRAATVTASVSELKHKINVTTGDTQAAKLLAINEIGFCNIALDRVVAFDPFAERCETGAFRLVDRVSGQTVGMGVIKFGLRRADNLSWQALDVDRDVRTRQMGHRPSVLWFTGLSGSGKSTVANIVEKQLVAEGRHTYILDGDNVRHGLNRDLGFTEADRVENLRRIGEVSRLMVDAGLIVIVSFISPFESERQTARALFEPGEFFEVFMDTPIEVCEQRDQKGLYRKARAGRLMNFTGIDSPYEPPSNAEITLRPQDGDPEVQAAAVMAYLKRVKAV